MDLFIIVSLILLSGLFSGLTLGLMSLSKDELERKMKLGDKEAKKVYSVRKNGNFLLCTLLLGNTAVNAVLSIYIGGIANGFMATIMATSLIVVFGEILPQSFCSKFPLLVGSKTVFLVKIFQFILYPIAKPLSMGLDLLLGKEMPTIFSKKELKEIIKTHEDSKDSEMDSDEEDIILGALSFSDKKVSDVMTPKKFVFMLDNNQTINKEILDSIKSNGHTRIPTYQKDSDIITGVLLTKSLIGITSGKVKDYSKDYVITVNKSQKLDDVLNYFTKNKYHLAVVTDEFDTVVGIITMEDIIEEILNREIVDETDKYVDMRDKEETAQEFNGSTASQ